MIPVFFDRDWAHPWRRPSEERRSVRLSAPPVRTVSPKPPHEPLPDEPFAPAYRNHVRLTTARNPYAGRVPARTDPLVFGPPGATELQDAGITHGDGWPSSCPCGVTWHGEGGCWACQDGAA